MEKIVQSDIAIAQDIRKRAYTPYSLFKVGALVRFRNSDRYYTGVNIENASYGASICAERSAICAGISQGEHRPIQHTVIVSNAEEPAPPCGLCLQFLAEFSDEHTMVFLVNTDNKIINRRFIELLPHSFTNFTGKDQ